MRAAFTGTQRGMTLPQAREVERLLMAETVHLLSHGDCIGADLEVDQLARGLGIMRIAYPGTDARGEESKRAHCEADVVMPSMPYLQRNQRIVDDGDVLIAAPGQSVERLRSGTWATVRYARKRGKRVIIVFPDGSVV